MTPQQRTSSLVVLLKGVLPEVGAELTPGERAVLSEWFDRLIPPPAGLRDDSGESSSNRW